MSGSTIDTSAALKRDFITPTRTVQVGSFMVSQPALLKTVSTSSSDVYFRTRATASSGGTLPQYTSEPLPHEEFYRGTDSYGSEFFPYEADSATSELPHEKFYRTEVTPPFGALTTGGKTEKTLVTPDKNVTSQRKFVLKNNFIQPSVTNDTRGISPKSEAADIKSDSSDGVKVTNPFSKKVFFNGKIDNEVSQGTAGDCWLLAGINAVASKPEGKKYLESLLTKNETNGTLSVHLKNPNATYTFTQNDINSASQFSMGDDDVRAIEMAVDKHIEYLQANGKYSSQKNSMVTGDNAINAWKFLLGVQGMYAADNVSNVQLFSGEYDSYDDVINDFSNPKKVFTFAVPNKDIDSSIAVKAATFEIENTQTGQVDNLYFNHAYSVMGADDSYVYLKNPHDTSITYRCARNLFENHKAKIEVGKLP